MINLSKREREERERVGKIEGLKTIIPSPSIGLALIITMLLSMTMWP